MALTRDKKDEVIKEIKEQLEKQKSMIFVDFTGIDANKIVDFKKQLSKEDCKMRVVKKSLFKITLQKQDNPVWEQISEIPGQLAIVFGFKEENSSPKITYKFSKENESLNILGGFLDEEYKTAEEITMIAQLPGRQELLANLTGSISSPTSNFVYSLKGNLQNLVSLLSQIKK